MKLFVAVNLPADERRAVWDAAASLRAAGMPVRWTAEPDLHITLRFLGEVEGAQTAPIGAALAVALVGVRPFDLGLGGIGAFPDFADARVLWIGVERHPALELLANDIERALGPFGFVPELKPFRPHLTIGRVPREVPGDLPELEPALTSLDYAGVIPVESVELMATVPGSQGSKYQELHRAGLGGGR